MAYALKDRLFAAVLFNGVEFPFEINALDFIHISSSVRTTLPALTFKVTDVTKFLTINNFLVDGTQITVTVGKEKQKTSFAFRLFSFTESPGASPVYTIRGYLDSPLYWTSSLAEFQKGGSNNVLGSLASMCSLKFAGTNTSDSQVWIPQNLRISDFADKVCQHGWANDGSCMQMGVTANRELRYRNVSNFAEFPVKDFFDLTKVTDKVKPITSYSVSNKAGFFNVSSGYGSTRVSQSILVDDSDVSTLTLQKNSSKLMVNRAVRDSIAQNKVAFSPVNVGNVHPNYERAVYQNHRLGSLFTLGMDVMTPEFSECDLLDVVSVSVENPEIKGSKQYSGKYLVTSKVLYVKGANYYEKLELVRHGLNEPREQTQE